MTDVFDIDASELAEPATLEDINNKAEEAEELQRQIDELDAATKQLRDRQGEILRVELPDAMASVNMSSLELESGTTISIKEFVSGSLPKDEVKKKAAIDYLTELDASDIIKTQVSVDFDKGEHNMAHDVAESIREQYDVDVSLNEGVHASTLQAFGRECLRDGKEVDFDKLNLFAGRHAKIKLPKKG